MRDARHACEATHASLMRTRHPRASDCAQNLHPVRSNGDSLPTSKTNERESPDA